MASVSVITTELLSLSKSNLEITFVYISVCVFLSNGTCVCVDIEHGVNTLAANVLKTLVGSDDLRLPPIAMEVFALWMVSPELGNHLFLFFPFDVIITIINISTLLACRGSTQTSPQTCKAS